MAYVVLWREPGSDRSTRSRCYWTARGAARRFSREQRRPPERRKLLRVAPFPGDVVVVKAFVVCIALLVAGSVLATLVMLIG